MQSLDKGKIILLNGVSSSGKTSIAKKLQEALEEPYFRLAFDDFEGMAPVRFFEGEKSVRRDTLLKVASGLHHSIAAFSNAGINVIVDTLFELKTVLSECVEILQDLPVLFVGVHCPVDELERRERERGDRIIGQAKTQLNIVHVDVIYDIEVNTYVDSLSDCARKIINALKDIEQQHAVKKLANKFKSH